VADGVGAGAGNFGLGRGGAEVSGFDGGVRRGGRRGTRIRGLVRAGQAQMGKLLHAMGDVHPHALKAELARELSRITFERWNGPGKSKSKKKQSDRENHFFAIRVFEAVEARAEDGAAGKRAGPGVIAFEGAYQRAGLRVR